MHSVFPNYRRKIMRKYFSIWFAVFLFVFSFFPAPAFAGDGSGAVHFSGALAYDWVKLKRETRDKIEAAVNAGYEIPLGDTRLFNLDFLVGYWFKSDILNGSLDIKYYVNPTLETGSRFYLRAGCGYYSGERLDTIGFNIGTGNVWGEKLALVIGVDYHHVKDLNSATLSVGFYNML